jgi:uncharacterized pyridoxal phosphate-containing UPF0001 family protein
MHNNVLLKNNRNALYSKEGIILDIEQNIVAINARIESACHRAGRKNDVRLVAVTKTVDIERIKKALDCGINVIGENKVQEIVDKFQLIDRNVDWHIIGHLQTNKIKYIVERWQ